MFLKAYYETNGRLLWLQELNEHEEFINEIYVDKSSHYAKYNMESLRIEWYFPNEIIRKSFQRR